MHRHDLRLVILGSGEHHLEDFFHQLQRRFPGKVSFYRGFSNELAHLIEAGSDLFLMPSHYEPCGLNQMYSLRYGTPPVVRSVGGLADTVEDWDGGRRGTGFRFQELSPEALLHAVGRATAAWRDRAAWRGLQSRGMALDFSWDRSAERYEALYAALAAGTGAASSRPAAATAPA